MCGRYFIDDEMWREIRKICKQIDDAKLKVTVGDVRPTDMAMVLQLVFMNGIKKKKKSLLPCRSQIFFTWPVSGSQQKKKASLRS